MKLYPWNYFRAISRRFLQDLKNRSCLTLSLWTHSCEYIMAQQLRRRQQIMTFYDRTWGGKAFRDFLQGLRRQVQRHKKGIMLSSFGIYAFDWNENRIKCDVLKAYLNEIEFVEKLQKETLMCNVCYKRKIISEKVEGIDYCICINSNKEYLREMKKMDGWEPYLEKESMIIWRKEERSSLFSYKVYVKFSDITAEDFLQVQTDIEYRKKWDDTALSLEIIDSDPEDSHKSQVIYWEMRWPKLFANRDYVYIRHFFTDSSRKLFVICSKSTDHPKCPVNPNKQRVNEYWSYMVIRPFKSFQQPGLEFVLTYFDDPGLAIPSTITSWVAQKQMPEFLYKLYFATKDYAKHKKQEQRDMFASWETYSRFSKEREKSGKTKFGKHHKGQVDGKKEQKEDIQQQQQENNYNTGESNSNDQEQLNQDNSELEQKKKSWWSYLHPHYYFA